MTKILIVDDEKSVVKQVRILLQTYGYTASFLLKPEMLFQRLEHEVFDLILLDVNMPTIDGVTLLKHIKENQKYLHIPVIMLTADTNDQMLEKCFQAGAIDYINKPISELVLKNRINSSLSTHQYIQKLKELNEMKSSFVSMVSHDFRNPLNNINLTCEYLENRHQKLSASSFQKRMDRIKKMVNRMNKLMEEVLVLGKFDVGKLKFHPLEINLNKFCEEVIEDIQEGREEPFPVIFTKNKNNNSAITDETALQHICSNLLSNAIKYSPNGEKVYFNLICDQAHFIIKIKDNGIGIPLEAQEHLFEPFNRAGNVGELAGTGLGLSIVKRSIELCQGTIAFESQEGVGTTMTVTVPLKPK